MHDCGCLCLCLTECVHDCGCVCLCLTECVLVYMSWLGREWLSKCPVCLCVLCTATYTDISPVKKLHVLIILYRYSWRCFRFVPVTSCPGVTHTQTHTHMNEHTHTHAHAAHTHTHMHTHTRTHTPSSAKTVQLACVSPWQQWIKHL